MFTQLKHYHPLAVLDRLPSTTLAQCIVPKSRAICFTAVPVVKRLRGFMNILKLTQNALQYISEGAARLFSPRDDQYPDIGVQPFEGEPLSEWVDLSNTKS